MIFIYFLIVLINKSRTSTSSTSATFVRVKRSGCEVFVHHFDTVAGSFPTCAANHLLVRLHSAKTTLMRFKSFMVIAFGANLTKIFEISMSQNIIKLVALSGHRIGYRSSGGRESMAACLRESTARVYFSVWARPLCPRMPATVLMLAPLLRRLVPQL